MIHTTSLGPSSLEYRPERHRASRELFERTCRYVPGGSSRTTLFSSPHPIFADHGEAARLIDVDGNVYIDTVNNFSSLIHGHANPEISRAVNETLQGGTCFGNPVEDEVQLAELICNRYPAVQQVRFANSGSEAVMQAVKAARAFTGRHAIAKIEGAYHGTYDYAEVSLKPNPSVWGPPDRPVSQSYDAGTPASIADDVVVLPFNNVDAAVKIIRENRDALGAVLLDALPTRVGMIRAEGAFLSAIQDECARANILLILDEVISLRLDYGGAHRRYNINPDLVSMAKIIGGGFPIGAVGGKPNVMSVFDQLNGDPQVSHTGTFNANRVSMRAGKVSLELLTFDAIEHINKLGEQLRARLTNVFDGQSTAWQVTGDGSCFRLHPKREPIIDYRSIQLDASQRDLHKSMYWGLINRGVMFTPGCYGYLSTATTSEDVTTIIDAVEDVLAEQKLRKA